MALTKEPKVTARKYGGDDAYSWAVFIEGQIQPFVAGLTRREVPYYKQQARDLIAERRGGAQVLMKFLAI